MQICNLGGHKSSEEIIKAEKKLSEHIRVTDTFEMHDTLTVIGELV